MTARTHDLAAITALGVIVLAQPARDVTLATALVAVLANQIGGITPDIDQPTAPFWRNLPITRFFGRFFDNIMGGHRFLTHSVLGVALAGSLCRALLAFLQPIMPHTDIGLVWWAFIIGMLSHLVMDTFTKEGVPWLLPVPVKFGLPPVKAFRITTGKTMEKIIFLGLLGFDIWYASLHYQKLLALIHQHIT